MTELIAVFATDFSSVDAQGRVAALHSSAPVLWYTPTSGMLVMLHDHEDNYCLGVVDESDDDLIYVKPEWQSWQSRSSFQVTSPAHVPDARPTSMDTSTAAAPPSPVPPADSLTYG